MHSTSTSGVLNVIVELIGDIPKPKLKSVRCFILTFLVVTTGLQFYRERKSVYSFLDHSGNNGVVAPREPVLRYDWTSLERLSQAAKQIENHQTDCSKPFYKFIHPPHGLGSNLHLHGQNLCSAVEEGLYRFRSLRPWMWLDNATCGALEQVSPYMYGQNSTTTLIKGTNDATVFTPSSMSCYFPETEPICPQDYNLTQEEDSRIPVKDHYKNPQDCPVMKGAIGLAGVRAATTEFYFTRTAPFIQAEAERQVEVVFGSKKVPPNLITIHVRWGDKAVEMPLQGAEKYVSAVHNVLEQRRAMNNDVRYWDNNETSVNIYLATEDINAVNAIRAAAPPEWNIFVDQFFPPAGSQNMLGIVDQASESGWMTLALLLLSMEANSFILTTGSNWSRLMNELRKNVLDPRCGGCTLMVDLFAHEER